jgi:hypothetical protein
LQKWEFAKKAQQCADEALDRLVEIAGNVEAPEAARVSAAAKILDRALCARSFIGLFVEGCER